MRRAIIRKRVTIGVPTLISATIPSAGTTISLLFSEAITIGSGGNAGWTLNTPTTTMTYSSGDTTTTLIYTLGATINSSDSPTISYTQPGDGLENGAGDDLASISGGAVTNNSTQGGSSATVLDVTFEGASEALRLKNLVDDTDPTTADGATTLSDPCAGVYSYDTGGGSNALVYAISNFDPTDFKITFTWKMPTYAASDEIMDLRVDDNNFIRITTVGTSINSIFNAGGTGETLVGATAVNDSACHDVELFVTGGNITLKIDGNTEEVEAVAGTWAGTATDVYWGIKKAIASSCDCYFDDIIITEN